MYCTPTESNNNAYAIQCGCSESDQSRIDLQARECRNNCQAGHYWAPYHDIPNGTFNNEVGVCVMCNPGTFRSYTPLFEWYTECDSCPVGTFTNLSRSSSCRECEVNTYAEYEGSSICKDCAYGRRTSGVGSNLCILCGTMYLGSKRCTIPWFGFILTFISLLICVIFYAAYTRYHRLKKEKEKTEVTLLASQELLDESVSDLRLLSEAMQVDDEEIVYHEMIAKGAYAEVYRATYAQRFEVAVKVIVDTDIGTTLYDEKEVHFLRRVRHRNVVRFFGAGQRISDKNLFIVMEYMDAGSLDSFLAREGENVSWNLRKRVIRDIVDGMVYLHTMSIHRDLKSGNVMLMRVNDEYRAKIADFGMSKRLAPGSVSPATPIMYLESPISSPRRREDLSALLTTQDVGTPEYMAPELIRCRQNQENGPTGYTNKIDVYAFGIMLWEIRECRIPWREKCRGFTFKVFREVLNGNRPSLRSRDLQSGEPENFYELMCLSWNQNPNKRPSFSKIKSRFLKSWSFTSSSKESSEEDDETSIETKEEEEEEDDLKEPLLKTVVVSSSSSSSK